MDNLQPLILNDSNGGGDWRAHQVTAEQVYKRQGKTKLGSEKLYELTDSIIQKNIQNGNLVDCGMASMCFNAASKYMTGANRKLPFARLTVLTFPANS